MSPAPRGQNARKIALRYLFFTLGLLINSFGIGTVVSALIVGAARVAVRPRAAGPRPHPRAGHLNMQKSTPAWGCFFYI